MIPIKSRQVSFTKSLALPISREGILLASKDLASSIFANSSVSLCSEKEPIHGRVFCLSRNGELLFGSIHPFFENRMRLYYTYNGQFHPACYEPYTSVPHLIQASLYQGVHEAHFQLLDCIPILYIDPESFGPPFRKAIGYTELIINCVEGHRYTTAIDIIQRTGLLRDQIPLLKLKNIKLRFKKWDAGQVLKEVRQIVTFENSKAQKKLIRLAASMTDHYLEAGRYAEALELMGIVHDRSKRDELYSELAQKCLKYRPSSSKKNAFGLELCLQIAEIYFKEGSYDMALKIAPQEDPRTQQFRLKIFNKYLELGKHAEAMELVASITQQRTERDHLYYQLSLRCMRRADFDSVLRAAEKIGSGEHIFRLGETLFEEGAYETAQKVITTRGNNAHKRQFCLRLFNKYLELGRHLEKALALVTWITMDFDEQDGLYSKVALKGIETADLDSASIAAKRMHSRTHCLKIAEIHFDAERYDEAQHAIDYAPNDQKKKFLMKLFNHYLTLKKYKEAFELIEKMPLKPSERESTYYDLSQKCMSAGQYDMATHAARQLYHKALCYEIAQIHFHEARFERAKEAIVGVQGIPTEFILKLIKTFLIKGQVEAALDFLGQMPCRANVKVELYNEIAQYCYKNERLSLVFETLQREQYLKDYSDNLGAYYAVKYATAARFDWAFDCLGRITSPDKNGNALHEIAPLYFNHPLLDPGFAKLQSLFPPAIPYKKKIESIAKIALTCHSKKMNLGKKQASAYLLYLIEDHAHSIQPLRSKECFDKCVQTIDENPILFYDQQAWKNPETLIGNFDKALPILAEEFARFRNPELDQRKGKPAEEGGAAASTASTASKKTLIEHYAECINKAENQYHTILGLGEFYTRAQVNKATKKLLIKIHPDKNPDPADNDAATEFTKFIFHVQDVLLEKV